MTQSILEFVKAGVDAGEAVLIASAGPVLQRLRIQLGAHGEHVMWTGMASATTNPRRITAAIRAFADEHPGQMIRCVQEPAWDLLPAEHLCEAIRHDALINVVLADTPATVLCAYSMQFDGLALACLQDTHPLLIQDGHWRPSGSFSTGALVPAECDRPLPPPPPSAAVLHFRGEQGRVRQFAADRARLAGLAADRVTDLVIAVGEAAANTLAHTGGPGRLSIWTAGSEILCQIDDSGHITDPLVGTFLPDPAAPGGGRGLWVVHQLCDQVEVRTGLAGTTLRLHVRLASPARPRRRGPSRRSGHAV